MSNGQQTTKQQVAVIGYEVEEDVLVERGIVQRTLVRAFVDVEELEAQVTLFMGAMEKVIGNLTQQVGKYSLDTVTVTAEVNAKGGLGLLGTGAELGAKGGMSFSFKRNPQSG